MFRIMKSVVICLFLAALVVIFANVSYAQNKPEKVVLASPFSPLAMPMAYILEKELLKDYAQKTELVIWKTPDQLRAMMAKGRADFVSVPSNVAAVFYNKGLKLKLLRVSIWGVFYVISDDPSVKSLNDLKGQEIFIPFRGDQPDLIFQTICQGQNLDPFKDFKIQYAASPLDVTLNLLAGKSRHALMIEPAAAMAIMKAKQKGKTFKRVIDVQKEWGKALNCKPKFPNAGVVALPLTLKNKALVQAFGKAYDKAVVWVKKNPKKAAELAAKYVKGVNSKAFEQALNYTIFESVNAENSKKDIEKMFTLFFKLNPKSIGGKLPDENFYR